MKTQLHDSFFENLSIPSLHWSDDTLCEGFRGGSSQYPQIRGDNYVEADPLSLQSAGPPQTRIFRNSQQPQPQPQQAYQPQQQAAYPATYDHRDLAGYSFQNINGQYINTGKK